MIGSDVPEVMIRVRPPPEGKKRGIDPLFLFRETDPPYTGQRLIEGGEKVRGLLNADKAIYCSENYYNFPELFPLVDHVECDSWCDFDCAFANKKNAVCAGIHFFVSDYKFERIWNCPDKYVDFLLRYPVVIQPDFSLYYDFPKALQIFNKYRNHWLYCYYGECGVRMIPNISVSLPDTYEWAFMGYPKHSVVAFSSLGCTRDKTVRALFMRSFDEMMERLEPLQVLYFTRSQEYIPSDPCVTVIQIPYLRR